MVNENPFSLMFGKTPHSIIRRETQYQSIVETFDSENPVTYAYMITGIRGSGKTVMLRELANEYAQRKGWIVLDGNSQNDLVIDLSSKLLYEGKKFKLFLDWSITVNAQFLSLQIGRGEQITNAEIVFERLLKKAADSGKRILITIDEISSNPQIKKFANFYQSMIGKNYPVFLLMTGLKNNIRALVNSDASSFLSRTPKIELPPLSELEIAREYEKTLAVSFPLAASLARLTKGYAFAYQVLGYLFFSMKATEITDDLLKKYDKYLQNNGYGVVWRELTNQEKKICFALAENQGTETKELMAKVGMRTNNFQNYRASLIEKGILMSAGYGKLVFALPRFDKYIEAMRFTSEYPNPEF